MGSVVGKCQMCCLPKKLIKAHVIPASISKFIKGTEKHLIHIHNSEKGNNRFPRQTNTWDSNILCKDCDNVLGKYETYGVNVLKQIYNAKQRRIAWTRLHDHSVPYYRSKIDTTKFILFILSILYKASVSQKEIYKYFSLGKYEKVFLEWLQKGEVVNKQLIEVVMFGMMHCEMDNFMKDGVEKTSKRKHLYRMIFPGLVIFVKIGKSVLPGDLKASLEGDHIEFPIIPFERMPFYSEILLSIANVKL